MWDTENKDNYQGLFARQPDERRETLWGSVETHRSVIGPDTVVTRDWYGQVQSTESSWFNS